MSGVCHFARPSVAFFLYMKLRIILAVCIALGASPAFAQKKPKSPQDTSPVLLTFGNKQVVTKAEFERVYQKNNGGYEKAKTHTPEQYREYMNLYINFKRKVFEAEAMGLDKQAAFVQEYEPYRKQLAQPYLTAKEVEERLVQEAYDRSKTIVNADHLLVNLAENASPTDTLAAWQKIMAYRDSVVKGGKDFGYMAAKYSSDPSAKSNRGNLGYFTAFDMVYPFESAAYNTPVGSVSMPVRSQFGYHLVKVNDRKPFDGKKRVAHLIVRVGDRFSAKDTAQARKRIFEIYDQLKAGADFAELVRQYSDDASTSGKGGDLGFGRLIPEMEAAKATLGAGEYTRPFQTSFGWHIMKVTEVEQLKSFDESKSQLKQKISRDSRAQISREALIERVKKSGGYKANEAILSDFAAKLPADFSRGAWKPDSGAKFVGVLFSIGDTVRTLQQFVDYLQTKRPRFQNLPPAEAARAAFKQYADEEVIHFEEARLPEINPDYRYLLKEYHDGILLFTLMEKMVWKKAVEDTVGLRKFYETNREQFKADESLDIREYRTTKREVAEQVLAMLKEGKTDAHIDSTINKTSSIALTRTRTFMERGKSNADPALFAQPVGYISGIIEDKNMFRIQVIEQKLPAGIKVFDMARSECITKYQDYLDQEWLKELAKKYPVKVNEKVFTQLYK